MINNSGGSSGRNIQNIALQQPAATRSSGAFAFVHIIVNIEYRGKGGQNYNFISAPTHNFYLTEL